MKKKSEGKTRKCLTLLGGRTSLLLCLSLMFQSSYAAEDSTVPEMGNMEIHQIAQQSSTIKGVVKDQKGEPLIGVSIVVKGDHITGGSWHLAGTVQTKYALLPVHGMYRHSDRCTSCGNEPIGMDSGGRFLRLGICPVPP